MIKEPVGFQHIKFKSKYDRNKITNGIKEARFATSFKTLGSILDSTLTPNDYFLARGFNNTEDPINPGLEEQQNAHAVEQ